MIRELFEALVSAVVLGIPFLACFFVPVFLATWLDRRLTGNGQAAWKYKPSQAWNFFILFWTFGGVIVGIKVVSAISAATGIK